MSDPIETRFTRDYGVRHPIALAPMAFVGTAPALAIAVCKAGGLGSLAVGPLPAEAVRGLVKAVKAATSGPLNVNFITFLANRAQIAACIDEAVASFPSTGAIHHGSSSPRCTGQASRSGNKSARLPPPRRPWIRAST
jgi:NAD(P)H-dependent flavin oxidoreductase YrpB (nitropropane dioxygenase family)